ncbi:hypothetical protein B4113_1019 [Geobacillus sp. B4113_201601]|nr:hypothetical protein B4113_1019 [Geobacillus sp. B4113_201601]
MPFFEPIGADVLARQMAKPSANMSEKLREAVVAVEQQMAKQFASVRGR